MVGSSCRQNFFTTGWRDVRSQQDLHLPCSFLAVFQARLRHTHKFLEPQSFFPFQPFVPIPCWIVSDAVRPIRYLTSLQTVVLFTCPSSLIVHSILLTQGKLLARTHGETQAAQLLLVTTLRQDASQGDSGYPCGLQLAGLRRRGPARVSDPPTHTSPLFLQTDSGILFLARLFPSPLVLALRCTKRPRP